MGTDIHTWVQVKENAGWADAGLVVFGDRNYALFGWLADIRNYSGVIPISEPRE